ncbi:dynein light chain Tctex-type protein 2B-like [Lineus longissimus]|uniref:dynein light chain Tctex-type protein 2B-like n=1 Tax=Lineus longissimus TaxID=88925 RepID=UPI002B4CEC31
MSDRLTEENVGAHQQQRKGSTSTHSRTDFPVHLGPTTLRRTSRAPAGPQSSRRGRAQSYSTISGQQEPQFHHSPVVKMEPSYQMVPDDKHKFSAGKVEKFMQPLLESYLDGRTYESKECAQLSKGITEAMKTRVKDMDFRRYKFIVNVTIGQNRRQGFQFASREVWNPETDNYATVFYQNSSLFAVATIFATYYE